MAIKRFFFEGARADVKPWGALEWVAPIPTAYVRIRLAAFPGIERPSIQKFFDRNSAIQEFLRELQLDAYRESWAPWDAMHRLGTPWNNRRLEVTKALGVRKS